MEEQTLKGLVIARRTFGECDADLEDFVERSGAHFDELGVPYLTIGPDVPEEEVAEIVEHASRAAAAVGAELSISYWGSTVCGSDNVLLPAEFDLRSIDAATALHVYTQQGGRLYTHGGRVQSVVSRVRPQERGPLPGDLDGFGGLGPIGGAGGYGNGHGRGDSKPQIVPGSERTGRTGGVGGYKDPRVTQGEVLGDDGNADVVVGSGGTLSPTPSVSSWPGHAGYISASAPPPSHTGGGLSTLIGGMKFFDLYVPGSRDPADFLGRFIVVQNLVDSCGQQRDALFGFRRGFEYWTWRSGQWADEFEMVSSSHRADYLARTSFQEVEWKPFSGLAQTGSLGGNDLWTIRKSQLGQIVGVFRNEPGLAGPTFHRWCFKTNELTNGVGVRTDRLIFKKRTTPFFFPGGWQQVRAKVS